MTTATENRARVELPAKIVANFAKPARTRVFHGGRGSGKTRSLAKMSAIYAMRLAEAGRSGVILCGREHLNSLDESSLEEVKIAIRSEPWLNDYFEIGEKYVRTKNRRISYAFAGLRHNLDSVKSKAAILVAWVDEAERVSEAAWRKLIPTIREEGSELWLSYNPETPESATHQRFRANTPEACRVTEINWRDNPWFPSVLDMERRNDKRLRPDTYDHIWEGGFLTLTDAQVFHGKLEFRAFSTDGFPAPLQGVDFGFYPDPLAAVRAYVHDNRVWVKREAYGVRVEIDQTTGFITRNIPGFADYVARADSAEPKTISYLQRKGLPKLEPVKKWPNSVVEGIRWLRGHEAVVIDPDTCPNTARDFRLYSHKIHPQSGDILPDIVDANNHSPDALRYACAPLIKATGAAKVGIRI
jgi:phage terminase large subunit